MITPPTADRRSARRHPLWRVVAPVLLAIALVVGLVTASAQAAPGNLPAPLGQATNAGTGPLGCPAGAKWKGFDANGMTGAGSFGPVAVAIAPSGRVWVSDFRNSEQLDATAGRLYSWPSVAAAAGCTQPDRELDGLNQPEGMAFDASGNMYLSITGDSYVVKFSPALLDTFSTVGAGAVKGVNVNPTRKWNAGAGTFPRGLQIGPDGKLYVAVDTANAVRVYDPNGADNQVPGSLTSATGICHPKAVRFIGTSLFVVNFHQNNQCGTVPQVVRFDAGQNGYAAAASFTDANAIDLTSFGTTLVASSVDGNVTTFPTATTGTGARPAGTTRTSLGQNGVTGSYDLHGPTFGMATVAANGNPTLVADGGAFRVLQVDLTAPTTRATTTTVTSSKNPSTVGDSVTFTAHVVPTTGTGTPTGTVQFKVDGTALGAPVTLAAGSATSTATSALTAGAHTVTAAYSGDATFALGTGTLQQQVDPVAGGTVHVTTGTPLLVHPLTTGPIADLIVTEATAGALPTGATVCFTTGGLPLGTGFTTNTATTPAVTASKGNGTAGAVTSGGNALQFTITKGSTGTAGATTYTVHGITVHTGDNAGPIKVSVGSACGKSDLALLLQPGFVGTVDRLAGSTRYATAEAIADAVEPLHSPAVAADCKGTAIVANGLNYPDALAASTIAGTTTPILLVNGTIPAETANAIRQHGVAHVVIVGGPKAVSDAIEAQLRAQHVSACGGTGTTAATITTERVAGADRYGTARAAAEFRGLSGGTAPTAASPTCTPVKTAIVASGQAFPDALAAGALAAGGATCNGVNGGPIPLLLTTASTLSPSAQQALLDMGIKQVLLVGGTSAVSSNVSTQIQAVGGAGNIVVKRIAGADRQETAAALAAVLGTQEFGFNGVDARAISFDNGQMLLTRGDTFPDALVGAPLAGQQRSPLLLTDSTTTLGAVAAKAITDYPTLITTVVLLGGRDALSQAVVDSTASTMAAND